MVMPAGNLPAAAGTNTSATSFTLHFLFLSVMASMEAFEIKAHDNVRLLRITRK